MVWAQRIIIASGSGRYKTSAVRGGGDRLLDVFASFFFSSSSPADMVVAPQLFGFGGSAWQ